MQNILVAGGAGFIGHHLVEKLSEDPENKIVIIDNLSSGSIGNIVKSANISFINGDITEYSDIVKAEYKLGSIDFIYNLACMASPKDYYLYPLEVMNACSIGVRNLLELASRHNAIFLQASTSEVYGDPECDTQREDYYGYVNSFGPRSCYDEGKRFAEALIYNYRSKVKVRIARIFNTYGPYMRPDDGRVISEFVTHALNNTNIIINGNGHTTRSFCYVDDTVDGLIKLANSDYSTPINIGNPQETQLNQLAYIIKKLTNSDSKVLHTKGLQDDPKRRCPEITKAKLFLNYEPKVNLSDGLLRTIEYFRSINNK